MVRKVTFDDLQGLLELYVQLCNNPLPNVDPALLAMWRQMPDDKTHYI